MRLSSQRAYDCAMEIGRQICREPDVEVGDALSDIAKLILWPDNTAPHLAALCGCSVRQAERYLGGECEWSGDAVAAVITEILNRRRVRHVRVRSR